MQSQELRFSDLLARAISEPGLISRAYFAFHTYSIGNQILALSQCDARGIQPGPLSTFVGWKDKGRFVRKGEKALTLCMPVTCKRKADEATTEHASEAETQTFTRFVFRPNWFVLAQTDGQSVEAEPLPSWDASRALVALDITEEPFAHLDGNTQGYATGRTIVVSPIADLPHKTRFHELAHVVLGHTAEGQWHDDERTPRNVREVEAEAVALLCIDALGLPGGEYSRGYLQHYNVTVEPIPERHAQRIFKAADQILRAGRS